ncbi:unnamed protein product [marine sediment metagenome]|uniref:Uncharacterized protein n=1 Tax=marine sediment metagenome TaxID=412755 RepID=X1RQT3_9ZZZZ
MNNSKIYKESIGKLLKETDDIVFEIRNLRRDNRNATMENDKKIAELEKKLAGTEATMEKTLVESKEDAIKPKCGWAHFRAMKDKIVIKDEKKTIEEFKVKLPSFVEKLIKISESIRKSGLNKLLESGEIRIEILDSVDKVPQERKFEYKYTG